MAPRSLCAALLLLAGLTVPAGGLYAQDAGGRDLRASQMKLDSIRQEQQRLRGELEGLQSRVRDASRELANITSQREASAAALLEIDYQTQLLSDNALRLDEELQTTRQRLAQRSRSLRDRLRAIYKRGPLHAVRVMLAAESFGDLMNRYKYLHILTQRDRSMIADVSRLERALVQQEQELQLTLATMQGLRDEKESQVTELERLEQQRQRALGEYRQAQTRTESRLEQLARDEQEMSDVIAALERARVEAERRSAAAGTAPAAATISTRDLGSLDWPVEGRVVYRFGPQRRPNGVVLRNQGIGIGAPAGTTVRAVEAGTVVMAQPFEGYGPTVMLSHGGGYYTLYLYLGSITVQQGQTVAARTVLGTVGGEQTPEGAHLEFQVRAPVRGGVPEAVDPLSWLRARAGGSQ